MNELAKRDFEWIEAIDEAVSSIPSQIAFDGNPKHYVGARLALVYTRLREESDLAVRLRQKLEEVAGPEVASSVF